MKKLFLTLVLIAPVYIYSAMAGAAEGDCFINASMSSNTAQIPGALNPDLPNARKIDPEKIIALTQPLQKVLFTRDIDGKLLSQSYKAFGTIKSLILQNKYIQSFGSQTNALASLLAFLYSSLVFKEMETVKFLTNNMEPDCCTCIPSEYRLTQALFTVLLIKEKHDANPDGSINYVSIASGRLKQDYITLSALIKLGVPHMQIAIIDPEYNFLKASEIRLLFHHHPNKQDLIKRDLFQGKVAYFNFLLQEATADYRITTGFEIGSALNVTPYTSTDDYLATIKDNEFAQPHVTVLSDSAGDQAIRHAIWTDFKKITAIINKKDSIISILDHDLEDKLFLQITKDNQKIVDFKEQNEKVKPPLTLTPKPKPRPRVKPPLQPKPRPRVNPPLQPKPRPRVNPPLQPKPDVLEKSMNEVSEMIDSGAISLEEAIEKFFNTSIKKMKFREHYHKR